MPQPFWSFDCACGKSACTVPRCPNCGTSGEFDGWHLVRLEAMARYQHVYGLKPIGPHRHRADELLGSMRSTCEQCRGTGILSSPDRHRWAPCGRCEGTGGFWQCQDADREAARRDVLTEFPDAGADRTINFLSSPLVYGLANGVVIDGAP